MEKQEKGAASVSLPDHIFRAYDIRGVVDSQLNADSVFLIARAIASEALDQNIDSLLVGYDGRCSSPELSKALIDGIIASGCNVYDLGLVPTPLLYFASHTTNHMSGVMLTASHSPKNYNGLKIVFRRTCLADNQIQDIRRRIENNELHVGQGQYQQLSIKESYINDVTSRIAIQQPYRLVIDCGNAVPGVIAPELFESLGCEVVPLYCDIDGHFPNHHPDPTLAENLQDLSRRVIAENADLGLGFDGDGDRLGVVTESGDCIEADRLLMLLAESIVPDNPGTAVVYDVKCSTHLAEMITQLGGRPVMHRSGHSFMKQKMQETNAALGGEFAAHIFIKDRWFGYDDGMYAAARIVELLSRTNIPASKVFNRFQIGISTPEIKIPVTEENKFAIMRDLQCKASFNDARLLTIDGVRAEYADGWGLVRASNTSPALLLRFEADSQQALKRIQEEFKALIHRADKSLELNF